MARNRNKKGREFGEPRKNRRLSVLWDFGDFIPLALRFPSVSTQGSAQRGDVFDSAFSVPP